MRLTLAAVTALALVPSACGGVGSEPNLSQAIERTQAAGSFVFELKSQFEEAGLGRSCRGVADRTRRRARLTCADESGGHWETITIDGNTYHQEGRPDGMWWSAPTGDTGLQELAPERKLDVLRSASRKIERVGDEDVRGQRTVRYALTVDCEPAELYACEGDTAVVDIWIDDEGLVRRVVTDDPNVSTTTEFFDFGTPVDIEAPSADQVVEFSELACTADLESPIRIEQAAEALRREGFDVRPEEEPCGTARRLENLQGMERVFDLVAGDGYIKCTVHPTTPRGIWFTLRPAWPAGSPPAVSRTLENLDCVLYVGGPRAEERIEALDGALAELKREHGP